MKAEFARTISRSTTNSTTANDNGTMLTIHMPCQPRMGVSSVRDFEMISA